MKHIIGNTGKWEYVIGLEVHAQVLSKSKLFSGSATAFGASPNSQVSLIDAAMPGMLPVLNEHCIYQAVKTGIALKASINNYSVFDRKNYFYHDLPQGYQISQFYYPIVQNGSITIIDDFGKEKVIRINRLHLEQDAGKSMHDQSPAFTFIDLNRAGVPLMEIVTEADISSPFEAGEYIKNLRNILRYIGTCDGDMEKGSMRCDANVSVRKSGDPLGTRCEIKNLNSIKNIMKAIEYEALRQVEILESGGKILQETRLFDINTLQTRTMRLKEDSEDYRYFPDPDLLPVVITQEYINNVREAIPELPNEKLNRYINDLQLNQYDAEVIVEDVKVAMYFEEVINAATPPKLAANWIISELFAMLNKTSTTLDECKIKPQMLSEMIQLIEKGVISGKIAKTVFEVMFDTGKRPEQIIQEQGLMQISDNKAIEAIIDVVLAENSQSVEEYRSGKDKLFGFFVGQIMKKTEGKASPNVVNEILKKKLS